LTDQDRQEQINQTEILDRYFSSRQKQGIESPCGKADCFAKSLEISLKNQTDQQNKYIKDLLEVSLISLKETMNRIESTFLTNLSRIETKHNTEIIDVSKRLYVVEATTETVKTNQVGVPTCNINMGILENKITIIEQNMFSTEDRKKILSAVELVQDKRTLIRGVSVTVISLVIMSIIGWMLYIYGINATEKRIINYEIAKEKHEIDIDKKLLEIQSIVEGNKELIENNKRVIEKNRNKSNIQP
jgi:hypothetical protein